MLLQQCPPAVHGSRCDRSGVTAISHLLPPSYVGWFYSYAMTVVELAADCSLEELLADRRRRGADRYDYQVGDRYVIAPLARFRHQGLATKIGAVALPLAESVDLTWYAGGNLGRLDHEVEGKPWYVVPDGLLLPEVEGDPAAVLSTVVALEIRSPKENVDAKMADYRLVARKVGLDVDEVWYVLPEDRLIRLYLTPTTSAEFTVVRRGEPTASAQPQILAAILDLAEFGPPPAERH